jgi:hypothetical protein
MLMMANIDVAASQSEGDVAATVGRLMASGRA